MATRLYGLIGRTLGQHILHCLRRATRTQKQGGGTCPANQQVERRANSIDIGIVANQFVID
jgi:hypothetical protein